MFERSYHITYWDLSQYLDTANFVPAQSNTMLDIEDLTFRLGYVYTRGFEAYEPHFRVELYEGEWCTSSYKTLFVQYYYRNDRYEE